MSSALAMTAPKHDMTTDTRIHEHATADWTLSMTTSSFPQNTTNCTSVVSRLDIGTS